MPSASAAPMARLQQKMQAAVTTGSAENIRHSPRDGVNAYTCSCVFEICQNVQTGGSDQPPVAGSKPVVLRGRKSLTGSEG